MSYESFGGAYGNSNDDYEGNPFSDHSGGFSNNDERVIDFEHSNDQPDNMRANGAYDGNEPSWHQRLSQGDDKSFMDDNNSQWLIFHLQQHWHPSQPLFESLHQALVVLAVTKALDSADHPPPHALVYPARRSVSDEGTELDLIRIWGDLHAPIGPWTSKRK